MRVAEMGYTQRVTKKTRRAGSLHRLCGCGSSFLTHPQHPCHQGDGKFWRLSSTGPPKRRKSFGAGDYFPFFRSEILDVRYR